MEKVACRKCGNEEFKLKSGHRKQDGNWIYINAEGRSWNGRSCPACNAQNTASKRILELKVEEAACSGRSCRICSLTLPVDRYFNHEDCFSKSYGHCEDLDLQYSQITTNRNSRHYG